MNKPHSHNYTIVESKSSQMLLLSLIITILFMIVETISGFLSGSLTLLADAAHMFTDAFAIFLSWFAILMTRKPKDHLKTYGYHRFPVITTFLNGISLLVLTTWIIYEAIYRIYNPSPINGNILFYVGLMGLVVNTISFIVLRQGNHDDMNIKSAIIHVLSDLLGSLAAVIAGIIIILTGKVIADPLLSLFVSLLLLKSTFSLISKSLHILMEGVPEEVNIIEVKETLMNSILSIQDLHHIHIWSMKDKKNYITFHIIISIEDDSQRILKQVKDILHDKFGIIHSTIQIEYKECVEEEC